MPLFYMDSNVFCTGVLVPYNDSFRMILVEFHKKHVPRELITKTIENTQNKDQGEENVQLFCYCQTPNDDSKSYVSCDVVHFNYMWIHFMCAMLEKPRKGHPWYCKYCQREKSCKVNKPLSS